MRLNYLTGGAEDLAFDEFHVLLYYSSVIGESLEIIMANLDVVVCLLLVV